MEGAFRRVFGPVMSSFLCALSFFVLAIYPSTFTPSTFREIRRGKVCCCCFCAFIFNSEWRMLQGITKARQEATWWCGRICKKWQIRESGFGLLNSMGLDYGLDCGLCTWSAAALTVRPLYPHATIRGTARFEETRSKEIIVMEACSSLMATLVWFVVLYDMR